MGEAIKVWYDQEGDYLEVSALRGQQPLSVALHRKTA